MRLCGYLSAFLILFQTSRSRGALLINEIANKGTSGTCNGNDWIELYNSGPEAVDMADGYILHDDNGIADPSAFTFAPSTLPAGEYMLLCTKMTIAASSDSTMVVGITLDDPSSPKFGISGDDKITLVHVKTDQSNETISQSRTSYEIISSVQLPNTDDSFDVTYAFDVSSAQYVYTSTPTPGDANIFTTLKTAEEQMAEYLEKLAAQEALGRQFFGMDERGYRVDDAMDQVLKLYVTMDDIDFNYMMANKSFEVYRPFQTARLTTADGREITSLNSPGNIRPKGQSTLYIPVCLGTTVMPFQLDFAAFNESQNLFGVEKLYLRHHMGDYSYSRDFAYNRMLARFGLPHLRVRKVEFYINEQKFGYYSLMEAAEQEYVFARSFPKYDPNNFALYKIKSMALRCGSFTENQMSVAASRLGDDSTPPYAFQRGEHRPHIEELGLVKVDQCVANFVKSFYADYDDVALALLRYDEDCAEMLMSEGLIDRDLGNKEWDKVMSDFITFDFQAGRKCNQGCANSDFAEHADVEQLLKIFAFYAVLVIGDSPMINGNNFYLAQSGEEAFGGSGGWKLIPYDFNAARIVFCHDAVCNKRMVHWSIVRPTCESFEENPIVGPLLSDPTLHAKYLEYVREFTETVYSNTTFIQEMMDHQAAQIEFVRGDFWSVYGLFYDKELTPDSANWEEEDDRFPLLATMKARAADIRAQLAALTAGTFPRGPHVGVDGDNEAWEYCPDWRSAKANTTTCDKGCKYEGCDEPGWTVESYCDEEFGTCYHANYDEQCGGIFDVDSRASLRLIENGYQGMENTEDGRRTFCRYAAGVPVKAAECPAVGVLKKSRPPVVEATSASSAPSASSATSASSRFTTRVWLLLTFLIAALQF